MAHRKLRLKTNPQLKLIELKEELMSKPKPDKFTASAKLEKHRQDKPFVQVEGKLTETQLEAIALW